MFFALMLLLGAIPGEAQALSDALGDKLLHLCAYSFLTCLLFGGLSGNVAVRAWRTLMMIGLLGGLDESIQSFMPYRYASMTDWLVDMLVAGLTLTLLVMLSNNQRRLYQALNQRAVRSAERSN
jgi:VanZ family protein